MQSDFYINLEEKLKNEFFHKLPQELGVKDLQTFHRVRDILDCRYYDGRTIGNVSKALYEEFMERAEEAYRYQIAGNEELRKIMVTGFLQKLTGILAYSINQ